MINKYWLVCFVSTAFFLSACSRDFKPIDKVDQSNQTTIDSLEAIGGKNRVRLSWVVETSDNTDRAVIQGDGNSWEIPFEASKMSKTITDLTEGYHTFIVYLFDKEGNRSAGEKVLVYVFGEDYLKTIANRELARAELKDEGLFLIWKEAPSSVLETEVTYTNEDGTEQRDIIRNDRDTLILQNYQQGTAFSYRTGYLPGGESLDTLYSPATKYDLVYRSQLTHNIKMHSSLIDSVYNDTLFQVTDGIWETDIFYRNEQGDPMHAFIIEADLSIPGLALRPGYNYTPPSSFSLTTISQLAENSDTGSRRVWAAINADFFTADGAPLKSVISDYNILKSTWNNESFTYVGVLRNGKTHIGSFDDYQLLKSQLRDALGASWAIVDDHQPLDVTDESIEPRTGLGITADNKIYFAVVDGRDANYSVGITIGQLGELLAACGSEKAVNLDGGGSSTLVIKDLVTNNWDIRNHPSDGVPRALSNIWMLVSE